MILVSVLAALAFAAEAPPGMKTFNQACPAKRVCPALDASAKKCDPKKPGAS
ncbi:MAG: hypothetical protein HY925_09465, partial [Elusimicrobia bacterium]|nr:hypothetical protein [Elusimicrobiota bacterium]